MVVTKRLVAAGGFICSLAACSGGGHSGGAIGQSVAPATSGVAPTSSSVNATPPVVAPVGPVRTAPANLATGPSLVLDASGQGAFFDAPFPSDARRFSNGALDFTNLPNPKSSGIVRSLVDLSQSDTRGASPTGAIWFRFDAAINAPVDDPAASIAAGSPILLLDIQPGSPERLKQRPFHASLAKGDSIRPANLLQVRPVPGIGLRPGTRYAAIVRRALGAPGAPFLGQSSALTELLAGRAPQGALGAQLQATFTVLNVALKELKIHPDDLAAVTVFTTDDPVGSLTRQVAHVDALPVLKPTKPIKVRDQYADFTALESEFAPPQYQAGLIPFVLGGGRQVVDASGNPVRQFDGAADFQLSVPKGKMPAAGFPLYFYVHGTGGLPGQCIDRGVYTNAKVEPPKGTGPASWLAKGGWATSCAAGPLSPSRIGFLSADGYVAYNFLNPVAMRDNFVQMVLELVHFRKLVLDLRIDAALCPGTDASAAADGKVRFDPDHIVISGQSLGSYLSGMLVSTLGGFQGAVLTGAGGSWIEFAFGPKSPIDLQLLVEALALPVGEKLDRFHPLVTLFELAVGPADNTPYLVHALDDPLPGKSPPHVLVVEGFKDLQVATGLQRALLLGLGIDMAGNEPGTSTDEQLLPVLPWSGRKHLSLPVTANKMTPAGVRTAVCVRYPEDGILEGHYVAFQQPEARRQILEFVLAIGGNQMPIVK